MSPGSELARGLHNRLPDWEYKPAEDPGAVAVLVDRWEDWQLVVEPSGQVDLLRRGRDVGHVQGLTAAELVALVTCSTSRATGYFPSPVPAPAIHPGPSSMFTPPGQPT